MTRQTKDYAAMWLPKKAMRHIAEKKEQARQLVLPLFPTQPKEVTK